MRGPPAAAVPPERLELALVGAFAFPCPQGSQVYARDQARALVRAGAGLRFFTYGRGAPGPPYGEDLALRRIPAWLSPGDWSSGPRWSKPAADAALLALLAGELRRRPAHAILAHNAEAALVALAIRRWLGIPVFYVAHTLLAEELSAYGPPAAAPTLDRLGSALDTFLARSADGILALSREAAQRFRSRGARSVRCLPPGLDPEPPPAKREIAEACRAHGLGPGAFALYTGNLDGYQDLSLLTEAARRLAARGLPLVVATHATGRLAAPVRTLHLPEFADQRRLAHGAAALVLPRRRAGGFPIKLLNYLETGVPVVAFRRVAAPLVHGESAWLLEEDEGAPALARAVETLVDDPERARALGAGGRRRLESHHAWAGLARETLDWIREGLASGPAPGLPPLSADRVRG